jgi:hypothetical protein
LNNAQTPRTASAHRHGPDAASVLRDPATIRERCAAITRAVGEGRSSNFVLDRGRLDDVARRVEAVTRAAYPTLQIPYHSRWRHFEVGGVDRKAELDSLLAGRSAADTARARIDLTVVSVLLDAGAGPQWHYDEAESGQRFTRSEGLGVASLRAFMRGDFSATAGDPLRVDASVLQRLDAAVLAKIFQSGSHNPLVGLEGRAALLRRLGQAVQAQAGAAGLQARPAALFDVLTGAPDAARTGAAPRSEISAAQVLRNLLDTFSSIWLTGSVLHGVALGDVWPHRWAGGEDPMAGRHGTTDGWVPFHKLSQWLAYSLLEPFEWAGVKVTALDSLTGLPEYRNGGLLIDGGVIKPRSAASLARTWQVSDEFIIEWRALTVSLLDELAPLVRTRLGRTAEQMPLACVLEGGTWATGRLLAQELRGGAPPLTISSDGTVF